MKIISNRLSLAAFMIFIFFVSGISIESVYAQPKMMEADIHSSVRNEVKKGISLPEPMPRESLLFELDKSSSPSAMLLDQEEPSESDATLLLRRTKKTEPYSMPPEPEPES